MEIGIQAEKCSCVEVCKRGVEPLNDCVCRLPGETVTAKCEVCKGTTWHNNGSCVACVRKVREEKKQRAAARHAEILAAPPHPVDLSTATEAEIITRPESALQLKRPESAQPIEISLRVHGYNVPLTKDPILVGKILQLIQNA